MRLLAAALVLLVASATQSAAQKGSQVYSAQAVCPVITAAIAAVVDSTAPIRVLRQPGTPRPGLDYGAPGVRAERVKTLVASLQVPKAVMERLLAAGSSPEGGSEIPDCGQGLRRSTWRGQATVEASDTVAVSVSLPVFTQSQRQALIYLEQMIRPPWDSTLSGGQRGSGGLYLLEWQADRWAVVRTAGLWVRLGE